MQGKLTLQNASMERTRFEGGNVVYNSYSKRGKNYLIN